MKRISRLLTTLLLTLMLLVPVSAEMVAGAVIYIEGDLIVFQTEMGLTVGEIYYGHYMLEKGDVVVGELHMYGLNKMYCPRTKRSANVWVDNFWLSKERAAEWVVKKR